MSLKTRIKNFCVTVMRVFLDVFFMLIDERTRRALLIKWNKEITQIKSLEIKNGRRIKMYCPSDLAIFRFDTFFTKEPETLEWIDSFDKNDVLWDVGANVGVYSLYAASKGIRVLAFEPAAGNFWVLNRNIEINHMDEMISAYPIAFSDKKQVGVFNMGDTELGGAIYRFGDEVERIECGEEEKDVIFRQGMLGISMGEFVYEYGPLLPHHIKIDVDSIELMIVQGGRQVLSNSNLKSVLIELDSAKTEEVTAVSDIMYACGLRFLHKKHSEMFERGKFKSIYNYVFHRK